LVKTKGRVSGRQGCDQQAGYRPRHIDKVEKLIDRKHAGNDIIGMPVVAYDTGEQIKKSHDLIFDAIAIPRFLWLMKEKYFSV